MLSCGQYKKIKLHTHHIPHIHTHTYKSSRTSSFPASGWAYHFLHNNRSVKQIAGPSHKGCRTSLVIKSTIQVCYLLCHKHILTTRSVFMLNHHPPAWERGRYHPLGITVHLFFTHNLSEQGSKLTDIYKSRWIFW